MDQNKLKFLVGKSVFCVTNFMKVYKSYCTCTSRCNLALSLCVLDTKESKLEVKCVSIRA